MWENYIQNIQESYSFTFWLPTESSEHFLCPCFRNCRVSAEFKNSLWYKKETVGLTLDPKGFSVRRSEYVLKQCVNGFKYSSGVCYKMGGAEGGRGNWADPWRAKFYSQVVEIHQNKKAKLVFRWQERQEKVRHQL